VSTTAQVVSTRPMAGNIGAEVHGIDVRRVDDALVAQLRELWLEHKVLVVRGQVRLTADELAAFGARFGQLYVHPLSEVAVHPLNIPAGGYWHSDVTFSEEPPDGTMLHCQAVPPKGGDTMWANMVMAYETLSGPMRAFLDGLRAVHDYDHFYRYPMGDTLETDQFVLDKKRTIPLPSHPVVRTHPETGKKALFVNESFTSHIEGLSRAESDAILELLYRHCVRPELTCRHRWEPGDIAFWDNRSTMHYPIDDWGGSLEVRGEESPRRMQRVTIGGARPQ